MKLDNLEKLYIEQLEDLHSAEKQLINALPKMAQAASDEKLQRAFEEHLEQTRQHQQRIEQILQELGEKPSGKKCKGMEGIIAEVQELLKQDVEQDTLDAALIAAAQHAEHYEMAGYGTVRTYARALGYNEAADLLQQTLDEEADTDEKLTRLAEGHVNAEAMKQ